MLNALVTFSLRFRGVVVALACVVLGYGIYVAKHAKLDVFRARQMLAEKLAETAGELPASVKTPRMTPLTSSTMDLLKIGLVTDRMTPMELRTFADWTLKPRLLSVPGVAKCSAFGGEVRQLQIQVLPDRLLAYGLSLSEVLSAARVSTAVMGAGFVETANQRITIQTEGQALTPDVLSEVVVANTNGFSVRLKDVARVVEGAEPKYGDCVVMGRPGVLLTMSSQYGANTMEVTTALEAALAELQPVFAKEGITLYPALHRPATFIEVALQNMKHSLVAIPLSLLTAVMALEKLGITINTITLGGLAIALGEVVDDSIIDVENIFRRLREFRAQVGAKGIGDAAFPLTPALSPGERGKSIFHVVLNASLEVRRAVVYATFIVALVFLPVLTLTGLQGSFFAPLALSYILAILASLFVALTVTPALSYLLFERGVRKADEPRVQHWLKAGYRRLLGFVMRWPRTIIVAGIVVCAGAATRLPFFGGEFLPDFREGHFVLQISTAPGTSLPEMLRLGTRISEALLADSNHIATVEQQVGRAELGEDPWGPHRSEFHVDLQPMPGEDAEKMADEIRGILGEFPGIQFEVVTFLGDRIGETISGETAPVVVSVFGDDLEVLDAKAQEVVQALKSVPGATDVTVEGLATSTVLNLLVLPTLALKWGRFEKQVALDQD